MRSKINRVPLISVVFRIANAYAYKGHPIHLKKTAPLQAWCHRIGKNLLFSIIIGLLCAFFSQEEYKPQGIILSIFPSILGFGIGVFALLFALPNEFLEKLRESVNNSQGNNKISGPEMLASDMAYPLMIYCLIMFSSVIISAISNGFVGLYIASCLLIYGLIISLELINSIFMTASYMLIVRKTNISEQPSDNHITKN